MFDGREEISGQFFNSELIGPACFVLGICSIVATFLILDGPDSGGFAVSAAELLWWPLVAAWAIAAFLSLRFRQGVWAAASAPLVLFPLFVYAAFIVRPI